MRLQREYLVELFFRSVWLLSLLVSSYWITSGNKEILCIAASGLEHHNSSATNPSANPYPETPQPNAKVNSILSAA